MLTGSRHLAALLNKNWWLHWSCSYWVRYVAPPGYECLRTNPTLEHLNTKESRNHHKRQKSFHSRQDCKIFCQMAAILIREIFLAGDSHRPKIKCWKSQKAFARKKIIRYQTKVIFSTKKLMCSFAIFRYLLSIWCLWKVFKLSQK